MFAAALWLIAAAFVAVHAYGAHVCERVLRVIEGTPHEEHVREAMPGIRENMIIVDLPTAPKFWFKARPSVFGYHPLNATVWLAIHANRFTLAAELVSDALLLFKLRWAEIGLMVAFFATFALSMWRLST
jgi:hypothetical protein